MKLLPVLLGSFLHHTSASCDADDHIFDVTCHSDLMVQLAGTNTVYKNDKVNTPLLGTTVTLKIPHTTLIKPLKILNNTRGLTKQS